MTDIVKVQRSKIIVDIVAQIAWSLNNLKLILMIVFEFILRSLVFDWRLGLN